MKVAFDDYEEFVGDDTDEEDGALCRKCNEYPCECHNEGDEDQ